jgi:hypothetical protein
MLQAWLTSPAAEARPDKVLAIGVGVLIGIITGMIFLLLMWQLAAVKKTAVTNKINAAVTRFLALPGFWFGGPWLTGRLIVNSGLDAAVSYYTLTLTLTFLVIIGLPLVRLVQRIAVKMEEV